MALMIVLSSLFITSICNAEVFIVEKDVVSNTETRFSLPDMNESFDRIVIEPKSSMVTNNKRTSTLNSITPFSLIGSDDRTLVTNVTDNPYYAIAALTITFSDGAVAYGTGYMISDNTMATAGHCIYNGEHGGLATSVVAEFGRYGDSVVLTVPNRNVSHFVYYGGYPEASYNTAFDYGFIKYNVDVGFLTGTIGIDTNATVGANVTVTGFPGDKATNNYQYRYMYTASGTISEVETSIIKYDADTMGGNSGSPVYYMNNRKAYAYAIHTNGGNYGRRLDSGLVTWLSDNGYLD